MHLLVAGGTQGRQGIEPCTPYTILAANAKAPRPEQPALSRFSRICLHFEFEAALILLRKSKINRGDSHEKLLRRLPRRLLEKQGFPPRRMGGFSSWRNIAVTLIDAQMGQ